MIPESLSDQRDIAVKGLLKRRAVFGRRRKLVAVENLPMLRHEVQEEEHDVHSEKSVVG